MHAFGHYFFVPDEIYIIEIHLVLNSKDLHIHSWYNTSTSILLHIGLSLAKEKRQTLYDRSCTGKTGMLSLSTRFSYLMSVLTCKDIYYAFVSFWGSGLSHITGQRVMIHLRHVIVVDFSFNPYKHEEWLYLFSIYLFFFPKELSNDEDGKESGGFFSNTHSNFLLLKCNCFLFKQVNDTLLF